MPTWLENLIIQAATEAIKQLLAPHVPAPPPATTAK